VSDGLDGSRKLVRKDRINRTRSEVSLSEER